MNSQLSIFDAVWAKKGTFLVTFFCIFTLSYGLLFAVDFLPQTPGTQLNEADEIEVGEATVAGVAVDLAAPSQTLPVLTEDTVAPILVAMRIAKLERNLEVLNPISSTIEALDAALLKGVVRHPDSGVLGKEGNILLLGHSSYLPTVLNKNYQAFNGIQKLGWGDTIVLSSANREYTYRVEKVYEAKASAIAVPTEVTGHRLTLITCDSFGAKEDRFVVEATLVSEKAI